MYPPQGQIYDRQKQGPYSINNSQQGIYKHQQSKSDLGEQLSTRKEDF